MLNKIWNSILVFLVMIIIAGIIYNEFSYRRFSRFDYRINVTNEADVFTKTIENEFFTDDETIDVPDPENTWSFERKHIPTQIHLVWFCFNDDSFYEFKGNIDDEKIKEYIEKENDISVYFALNGILSLKVGNNTIQQFKGIKISRSWFDKNIGRDKIVFFARQQKKITPYLNLESDSKFSEMSSEPVTFYYLSKRPDDYADSLSNGKLLRENIPAEINLMEHINLKLLKTNNAKKGTVESFRKLSMELKIGFDTDQLYEVLKSNPGNKYDLIINLDRNDSLKSVYLSDKNEKFKLNVSTDYNLKSSY
nr:hypothetical protein [uncultured Chryseobacterium sp.]